MRRSRRKPGQVAPLPESKGEEGVVGKMVWSAGSNATKRSSLISIEKWPLHVHRMLTGQHHWTSGVRSQTALV